MITFRKFDFCRRLSVVATGTFVLVVHAACSDRPGLSDSSVTPNLPEQPDVPESPTTPPNVVLILTDQQSYNTISAHASQFPGAVYASTPHIDRLVNSGVSFTRAYCANAVSVPSRFSLFTGVYGARYGVRRNSDEPAEKPIREVQQTHALGKLFREAGYETLYGGKVHLPYSSKKVGASSKFQAPDAYGFDTYYTKNEREGLASCAAEIISNKARALDALGDEEPYQPFLLVASFLNPHDICVESQANVSPDVPEDPKEPEKSATIREIRQRMASFDQEEFFTCIAPQLPDNKQKTAGYPNTKCSKKRFLDYPDNYWRQYRWVYGQLVSLVDSHIGKILDALDAHPKLKENTLVVFTSDHGEMQGAHGAVTKSLPFEECQRVPFIFAGRGVGRARCHDMPVCNGVDLLPTLCELAGIEVPDKLDGISLASVVKGEEPSAELVSRRYVYSESETFVSVWNEEYKLSYFDLDGEHSLLVNLKKDAGEMENVASDEASVVERMKKELLLRN
ncbi:sulfatase [Bacteroides uniformis]|uniref:Sulfatase n=1 Tax=Bacteroides uniformis TaxID=820 RepID=A0A174S542_BACUN|nr:sulfatase-like hydrolase/transferase [Bacteroides uniformis]CUP91067.1 sulfatase [Bacteroides uniformis]